MTGSKVSSKSGLFLIELIIAIVFFAFSSAICVQLFAKAHVLSGKSSDLNAAVVQAQNAAELFSASRGSTETLGKALLEAGSVDSVGITEFALYYDESWNRTGDGFNARYMLTVVVSPEDNLMRADIAVVKLSDYENAGGEIYSLMTKSYFA